MTVDATDNVALYAGGGKIREQAINTGFVPAAAPVAALRFGSTEPSGFDPASLVLLEIRRWGVPLTESDALAVSGDFSVVPVSGSGRLPVIDIAASVEVLEGQVAQILVSKTGAGAASVVIRTVSQSASPGTDYVPLQQTLGFASETTAVTVNLLTLTDALLESNEVLAVELVQPDDCVLGNAVCVVRIRETLNGFSDHFTAEFFSPVTSS
jgi:hypothetical protein